MLNTVWSPFYTSPAADDILYSTNPDENRWAIITPPHTLYHHRVSRRESSIGVYAEKDGRPKHPCNEIRDPRHRGPSNTGCNVCTHEYILRESHG